MDLTTPFNNGWMALLCSSSDSYLRKDSRERLRTAGINQLTMYKNIFLEQSTT